jgi:hypothetical protein
VEVTRHNYRVQKYKKVGKREGFSNEKKCIFAADFW